MATNPYKSFTPFTATLPDPVPVLSHRPIDPSAGAWSTAHMAPVTPGEAVLLSTGNTVFTAVQFNERILPGKVRDEQVAREVAKLAEKQGHKVSKKEYAEIKSQVEFDLLPRAFIRRTTVPVIFRNGYMLVCTTSAKRCDDTVALLQGVLGPDFVPRKIETVLSLTKVLTTLAREGYIDTTDGDGTDFTPTDSAVLKGDDKRVVRIKERDTQGPDVQALLTQDYRVTELGLQWGEAALDFSVDDKMTFKRLVMPGVVATMSKEDAFGFAELCASTYVSMLDAWISACGGLEGIVSCDDDGEL